MSCFIEKCRWSPHFSVTCCHKADIYPSWYHVSFLCCTKTSACCTIVVLLMARFWYLSLIKFDITCQKGSFFFFAKGPTVRYKLHVCVVLFFVSLTLYLRQSLWNSWMSVFPLNQTCERLCDSRLEAAHPLFHKWIEAMWNFSVAAKFEDASSAYSVCCRTTFYIFFYFLERDLKPWAV